ncbi:MAG: hypothetical protein ACQET7_08435 [Thermodesulfobacteriota bacterium]
MIAPAIASVEVGTHTARLLLARAASGNTLFQTLARERRTIRLADGFGSLGSGVIQNDAARRAAEAVGFFTRIVREAGGEIVRAVSTGVTRTAKNRHEFIQGILDETGVRICPVSGEEEAGLTARGVLYALGYVNGPYVIFDLGGGTTEFVIRRRVEAEGGKFISLPLGALLLKEAFFHEDPLSANALAAASHCVDKTLWEGIPDPTGFHSPPLLIGSGGTLTTLAAMALGIEVREIGPERMNGLLLQRGTLEALYDLIIRLPFESRRRLRGLDPGRADVIPAGALAVLRILHYFEASQVVVCLSDILEGLLIEYLQGDGHE